MTIRDSLPFGSWPSPITIQLVTADSVQLDELRLHQTGIYWIERRPDEQGRCAIVRHSAGQNFDLIHYPYSARSRVHEYGGGAYCVTNNGIYFVNDADQNIYFCAGSETPVAITRTSHCRYADIQYDHANNKLICIREYICPDGSEPANHLISIDLILKTESLLHHGHDFYASPRLSPDGTRLSWLSWDHPDMPWDKSSLYIASISPAHQLDDIKKIQHPETDQASFFQPGWSPDNQLYFVSDLSGWWNLYRYTDDQVIAICPRQLEFGLPQWVFAQSSYAFIDKNNILCAPIDRGIAQLASLDLSTGELTSLNLKWNSYASIQTSAVQSCFIAASAQSFPEIINLQSDRLETVKQSCDIQLDTDYYSYASPIKFRSRHQDDVYAIYYAPVSKDFQAPAGEKPPLIVLCHGGPTAMTDPSLDMRKQFWTSRGFALLDVNYSGSTGYGRAYRERLNGNWGLRDAEDCCDAALHLVRQGLVDPERLIIKGSSAGGYTVLCALTFHDTFSAGASYYGIGELESLLVDTHKFESRYLDRLIGAYPEFKDLYQQRSPINHVDQLSCPVIFFQGTEDRVVPKEQAEKMFTALKNKGIPVAYVPFQGEQHGFRKAETIQYALDAEYAFYVKIFAMPITLDIDLQIENLKQLD
ncbi:MAG: prolyl oligopeptidase family serine peptidase [Gammaproteobacteria bacterium]|nr:prolyl oligopeptidase family serine peptidase [Gammaproteobacteria bacterium]